MYMVAEGTFDKLVSSLSLDERQNLLKKLKDDSNLSAEPLYVVEDSVSIVDTETAYLTLPWYHRLWYFMLGFFNTKPPKKLFQDRQVAVLGNKINKKNIGLYDYQKIMLLPAFFRQLSQLKDAAHFFYSALEKSVNRDRGAFFAFLASLEMPAIHKQLTAETDPAFFAEKYPGTPETDLRHLALKAMDEALAMITEEQRNTMYFAARALHCLMGLASFLYDRVLMLFEFNKAENGETCSANVVKDLLISLNNILLSLKRVPPMTLLESLFVFVLQERINEPGFNMEQEIRLLLTKAETSLGIVRDFNKKVPLTWILRCCSRNMALSPVEISGGEDWFVIYRSYWKRRLESLFSGFLKERRQRELEDAFSVFFKGKSLKGIDNIQIDSNSIGLPIYGGFALSFLYTFSSEIFMPFINGLLRHILINGSFSKRENHAEFSESYNNLIKLDDEIKRLEYNASLSGEYGKRYEQIRKEMTSLPVKRRRMQIVIDDASEDAEEIISGIRKAAMSLVGILGSILGQGIKSKHDTITNLNLLIEKDRQLVPNIERSIQHFKRMIKLLDDIEVMEQGR